MKKNMQIAGDCDLHVFLCSAKICDIILAQSPWSDAIVKNREHLIR